MRGKFSIGSKFFEPLPTTNSICGSNSEYGCYWRGLRLLPDAVLTEAPQLDLLHVPGGLGQEALMDDEDVLAWICNQATGVRCLFSVCTGALICGAAGLLKGRKATTHWASMHLLHFLARSR
jgi:cyclohexyl-isocyanide hydratase